MDDKKKQSILNKRIEIPHETEIKRVALVYLIYYWLFYLFDILEKIPSLFWTRVVQIVMLVLINAPVFFIYHKWVKIKEKPIDLKNGKQYIWVPVLLAFYFLNLLIQSPNDFKTLFGQSNRIDPIPFSQVLYCIFFYFVIVAVTEEFVFRIYMLNELRVILGRFSWIAPIISGVCFGWLHYVQTTMGQVWIAMGIGIILSYVKLYAKNCTFLSLVLAHGLYDLMIWLLQ